MCKRDSKFSWCFNIVSVVTDNVDDNGENKGVIEKELTKIKNK